MLKGCKHYFTMFGVMLSTINMDLKKLFTKACEQLRKSIFIQIDLTCTQLKLNLQKNQTYQG
ncbi:MAG: hypothetical protein K0U47_09220 [Epsilonproteobacteria bacterium]|nr:hypothetical protein [Campylobacterota bacterium]